MAKLVQLSLPTAPEGVLPVSAEPFSEASSGVYELAPGVLRVRQWPEVTAAVEARWVACAFELIRFVADYELEVERKWLKQRLLELLERGEAVDEELLQAARVLFGVE